MQILKNHRITDLTTFGVEACAAFFAEAESEDDVRRILRDELFLNRPRLLMGGGSNLLFTSDYPGFVLKINMKGISLAGETSKAVFIKTAAGEVWDEFADWCIERNYGGTENMVAIPGTVGSSAVQNIGAYGSEVKDIIYEVETLEITTGKTHIFSAEECRFGYRDSIFKRTEGENFVVISVLFKLSKKPNINIAYGDVSSELTAEGIAQPGIKDVARVIRNIRSRKLPDPKEVGNAGSFFKNPVVQKSFFEKLKVEFPAAPSYPVNETSVKVPAAWLIEQCGWKGYRKDDAGVYEKQPLVLVNYGKATGAEIHSLSKEIQKSVSDKFGIALECEVRIL